MRSLYCIFAVLAAGCPSKNNGDASVELGTGTTDFIPLSDGDELEVVPGPQGGFHFHVHARMTGLDPGDPSMPGLLANPSTTFAAFEASGEQVDFMFPPYRLGYVDIGGDQFELPSGRILQLDDDRVQSIYGQSVRLTLSVSDTDGRSAETEVTVTAIEADVDAPDAGADAL